jgi:hypothetical protein
MAHRGSQLLQRYLHEGTDTFSELLHCIPVSLIPSQLQRCIDLLHERGDELQAAAGHVSCGHQQQALNQQRGCGELNESCASELLLRCFAYTVPATILLLLLLPPEA